ncbi:MAG: transposase [Deltaproteobacteria bacterium]|nr:transposase [Deltaproteobacteria bacterium]
METEQEETLGRTRYERSDEEAKGYRNGYEDRKVKTAEGIIDVSVPQIRVLESPWLPAIWKNIAQRSKALEDIICEMWVRGIRVRDVEFEGKGSGNQENREKGKGNRESGNREKGTGNREQGIRKTGNRVRGRKTGSRVRESGNRESGKQETGSGAGKQGTGSGAGKQGDRGGRDLVLRGSAEIIRIAF